MKCDALREWVWTAADGGLAPEQKALLDAHLAECAACRAAAARAHRVTATLSESRIGGPIAAPAELCERTLAALDATAARPAAPIGRLDAARWRRFAPPLALVAATLVVVIGWFQTRIGAPASEQLALRDDAPAAAPAAAPASVPGAPPASESHDRKRGLAGDEEPKSDGDRSGFDKQFDAGGDAAAPPAESESDEDALLEGTAQWSGELPIEPAQLLAAATPAEALVLLRAALPREERAKPKGRASETLGSGARGRGKRGASGDTEKAAEGAAPPPDQAGHEGALAGLAASSAAPTRLLFARLDGVASEVAERVAGLDRAETASVTVGFLGGLAPGEAAQDGELFIVDLDEEEWLALEGVESLAPEAWFALRRVALAEAVPAEAAKEAATERAPIGGAKRPADARAPATPAASGAMQPAKGGERRRVRVVLFLASDAALDDDAPARAGRDRD